jgi:hypothetical protein
LANRITLELEGQYIFVNSMGSHFVCNPWMYQYYGFGLMAQWAETCWCVTDELNVLYYCSVLLSAWSTEGVQHVYFGIVGQFDFGWTLQVEWKKRFFKSGLKSPICAHYFHGCVSFCNAVQVLLALIYFSRQISILIVMCYLRAMLHAVLNVFFSVGPEMDCFTLLLCQPGTNISFASCTHMYHEDGGSCCITFQMFPPTMCSTVMKKKRMKKGLHCIKVQWNQTFLAVSQVKMK